jgi:putative endonuclease
MNPGNAVFAQLATLSPSFRGAAQRRTRNPDATRLCPSTSIFWQAGGTETLYLGVTSDLIKRVYQHKTKAIPGFTSRYGVDRLVWYEVYDDAVSAITREKEIKKWRRAWKIQLIEKMNPEWRDLYDDITK